jgi:hypothetical protein
MAAEHHIAGDHRVSFVVCNPLRSASGTSNRGGCLSGGAWVGVRFSRYGEMRARLERRDLFSDDVYGVNNRKSIRPDVECVPRL